MKQSFSFVYPDYLSRFFTFAKLFIGLCFFFLYMDDILMTSDNSQLFQSLISALSTQFAMKDLGLIHYFLAMKHNVIFLVSFFLKLNLWLSC